MSVEDPLQSNEAEQQEPTFPRPKGANISVNNLKRWSLSNPMKVEIPPEAKNSSPRINFDQVINQKVILWKSGDVTKLEVDAIVNSTNESVNERNGISEKIISIGGTELVNECLGLEGCRTGEAKITGGFGLPSRYVIHTVGPRYNLKYRTAAESALHNCYRGVMEIVKEYNISTVAFTVINTVRRGYPPEAGAHMALRTVRRFLEKFGEGIETVIFNVVEDVDERAYDALLPLYFPRSSEEAIWAIKYLPEDLGNEMGEPVLPERKIRIAELPGASSRLNQSVISEDDPLRSWASDEAENKFTALATMQGDHDAIRKEEINQKISQKNEDQIRRYARYVKRAKAENFTDINSKNIIYQSGVDSLGRPIICVSGKLYNPDDLDSSRTILYIINFLDHIANKDYVVVYFNAEATSENHPDISLIRELYNVLHPKYRRNLKLLYIVHPTWWVRLTVTLMNTFFTSDIREKIKNIDRIIDLYEYMSPEQVRVPEYVISYDIKENGAISRPTQDSFNQL